MKQQIQNALTAAVLTLGLAATTHAQANHQKTPHSPEVDVAGTFVATRALRTTSSTLYLYGAGLDMQVRAPHNLGFVTAGTGLNYPHPAQGSLSLSLVTVVFGPRYTLKPGHGRLELFGEGLGGVAFGFNSAFPSNGQVSTPGGVQSSAHSLALQAGGGVDYTISPRIGLRLVQVDYLRTQLPNATTNTQNNLRLGSGIVLRLSR